jgi:hypothetical protein
MAAGLGFKTFTTGEVLTAGDVNGYLMQGINVFASEAARNAAITSPQEGQFAFTKDTNSTWYYDGAAWVASGASGDVTGVTAGTGITVTDPSGPVPTVTNSMATAIDAKGDLVAGTGADAFSRLAVGANNTVLTADSTTATGLKWATPSAGSNWSLLNTGGTSLTGSTTITVSGISGQDKLMILIKDSSSANGSSDIGIRFNGDTTGTNYQWYGGTVTGNATYAPGRVSYTNGGDPYVKFASFSDTADSVAVGYLLMSGCNSSGLKVFNGNMSGTGGSGTNNRNVTLGGYYAGSSTISSVSIISTSGNWDAGTVFIYGSA